MAEVELVDGLGEYSDGLADAVALVIEPVSVELFVEDAELFNGRNR